MNEAVGTYLDETVNEAEHEIEATVSEAETETVNEAGHETEATVNASRARDRG